MVVCLVDPDRVDDDVLAEGGLDHLLEPPSSRVVSAVADDDPHSPRPVALVEPLEPHGHRIEERSLTARRRSIERPPQLGTIAGEQLAVGKPWPDSLVEIQGEELVGGMAG